MVVKLTKGSSINSQLDAIVRILYESSNLDPNEQITFDLSDISFVHPLFALPFGTILNNLKKQGYQVEVTGERDSVKSYLDTICFPKGFTVTNQADLDSSFETYRSKNYLPIVRFSTSNNTVRKELILSKIEDLLKEQVNLKGQLYIALKFIISELTDNIVEHSKSKSGWIFAQYYPVKECLDICILDIGRTILGSYKDSKEHEVSSHGEAVQKALSGVSTKSPERGFGLHTSRNIIQEGLDGDFVLFSGDALLVGNKLLTTPCTWDGTLLFLRIPRKMTGFNIYNFVDK